MWYKYKLINDEKKQDEIIERIEQINNELYPLKKQIKLCDGIEERIPSIEKNINEYIEQDRKESEKDEHIK